MSDEHGRDRSDETPPILVAAAQLVLDLASDQVAQAAEDEAVRDGARTEDPVDALHAALGLIEDDLLATTRDQESMRSRDDPPQRRHDQSTAMPHMVSPARADLQALRRVLAHVPSRSEQPQSDSFRYLDSLIFKPWGYEYRVYDDILIDVWFVAMHAGTRSSLHAHVRKDTLLLCLDGQGMLTAGDGREIKLVAQTSVHILPGAPYRVAASTGMTLMTIENPRDKLDLIRFTDDSGRSGRAYESAASAGGSLRELDAAPSGPPRARLRNGDIDGRYRVSLETGEELRAPGGGGLFALSLDIGAILSREWNILRANELHRAEPEQTYLTIRDA